MHGPELLVHVTAAARILDDRKYLTLVQSIVDFQPITRHDITVDEPDISLPSYPAQSVHKGSSFPLRTDKSQDLRVNIVATPAISQALLRTEGWKRSKPQNCAYNEFSSNPKTSWEGSLRHTGTTNIVDETSSQVIQLSAASKPNWSVVEVPYTGHKRCRSPSWSSIRQPGSNVPNSQGSTKVILRSDLGRSMLANTSSPCVRDKKMLHITHLALSETSFDDERPTKRHCSTRGETPEVASPVTGATDNLSTSTTASPSQLATWEPQQWHSTMRATTTPIAPVTIDLISPNSEQHSNEVASSPTPCRGSVRPKVASKNIEIENQANCVHRRIYDLPYEVNPPAPLTANAQFITHITDHLEAMAKRLPLAKYFRPCRVSRDVRPLERGHWRMVITIAPFEVVDKARAVMTGEEICKAIGEKYGQGSAGQRFLAFSKHIQSRKGGEFDCYDQGNEERARGIWTEEEYVNFWESMSQFVKDGKAGWGTRIVREEQTNDDPVKGSDAELTMVRLRIFTWGEIIGHMWLAIWVLSGKVSERIAMEWVAADGQSVIQMAGSRREHGKLGPWIQKSRVREGEGRGTSWGVFSQ